MSTAQKVWLAEEARGEFGLPLVLGTLGLPRSSWQYRRRYARSYEEKYRHLKASLEGIAQEHPEYGYRRTVVELREAHGERVNHKVIQRLHRLWGLPLLRQCRRPKPGGIHQAILQAGELANLVASLEEIAAFTVLYTDFTELLYGRAKAHLIVLLDHKTKLVLGWAVGEQAVTELALEAWRAAKKSLRRWERPVRGIIVHQDRDPVFTGYGWAQELLLKDACRLSYSLEGAKGNPEMESFYGRFKTENRSLFLDALDLRSLRAIVASRIRYYNRDRRHSSLGNQAPEKYARGLTPALSSQ